MLLRAKASCFADACDLALGAPADQILEGYMELVPDSDPKNNGFHPHVVSAVLLDKFMIGLTQIDLIPTGQADDELGNMDAFTDRLVSWFSRPDFRCVVTGPKVDGGEEHALAFNGGTFIDPAGPVTIEEPNINIRTVWLLTLPPVSKEESA
jgi:hypothetical protein